MNYHFGQVRLSWLITEEGAMAAWLWVRTSARTDMITVSLF